MLQGSKKNLALDLGGRRNKPTVLNSFGGNQLSRYFVHLVRRSTNDDDFKTVMHIEMNMEARVHPDARLVLHIRKNIAQVMRPMIIQKTDNADHFFISLADLLLNQVIANQVANGLRTILIPLSADAFVERLKEIVF